jgi:PDZ domain-containing protein
VLRFPRLAALTLAAIVGIGGVAAAVGAILPSDSVLFLPTPALPVGPLLRVAGTPVDRVTTGPGILYVAVAERPASRLEALLGDHLHAGADVVAAADLVAPGSSPEEQDVVDRTDMSDSQQVAAIVAERAAGRKVTITAIGARVNDTAMPDGTSPARTAGIRAGNVITAIDGTPITALADLRAALARHRPGDRIAVTYRSTAGVLDTTVVARAAPGEPNRALLGIGATNATRVTLPVPVRYLLGDVVGPSAGLAFALEIYRDLAAPGLTRGHRVAVTGTIAPDGSVGPIGGVRQKALGAAEAGADVFLVPAANLAEARAAAPAGLRVIAVTTFDGALATLHALAAK